jgi:hypothetical protein
MADHAVSCSAAIIEAAISVFEEVLRLRPIGHARRAEALGDLGLALFLFCSRNETHNLRYARSFDLLRETLELCPPGHPSRDRALHNLAGALKFGAYDQQSGGVDSLNESILLNREALQLRPAGHPERAKTLNNLACGLERSFEHLGDLCLLEEAITLHRGVLQLWTVEHPMRSTCLMNLALALQSSFRLQGGSETLAEAVSIGRELVQIELRSTGDYWRSLNTLGNALGLSFASNGFAELLLESTSLLREAAQLAPLNHPDRGIVLSNFAQSLMASFRHFHDRSVLAEAISLFRESIYLPCGEDYRSDNLNELAEALITSFDEHNQLEYLHEAVKLHREALVSRPPGHCRRMESLHRLGRVLCRPECQSWTEALGFYRQALDTSPAGSSLRAEILCDSSRCFLDPDSPFFDLSQGIAHLSAAYSDNFCHVNRRLRLAMSDLPRVERAYSEIAANQDASTLQHYSTRVLDLYAQIIGLLPRAANLGLDHSTRLLAVTGLDEIARNAAARAVLVGRETHAVEMLEEGRGIFWTQALHQRTNAFDDVPQEDSQELQRLLHLLDHSARRVESSMQTVAQRERDLERRRLINEKAEALILKIRGYKGLGRFLLPPTFDALVRALPNGIVVIVTASKLGHHALLLRRDTGLVTSITLQPPPKEFDSATFRSHLPRDVGSDERGGEYRAMRKDTGRGGSSLVDMLAVLWKAIVQPVITQLGLQVRYESRD